MVYSYLKKISGPLLDRIDLQLFVQSVDILSLKQQQDEVTSEKLFEGVKIARNVQHERYESLEKFNYDLQPEELTIHCKLNESSQKLLQTYFEKFEMSMRGYHKVIKVSRTIADLENEKNIQEYHVKEALMYRSIEQKLVSLKKKL